MVACATNGSYLALVTYSSPKPRQRPADVVPDPKGLLATIDRAEQLRNAVRTFVRSFGLLSADQAPCGIPVATSYAHALMFLLERGSAPPSQQELGSALGIDKSNAARLAAKLEADGCITQERSEEDARRRQLVLTADGRRLARTIDRASRERFSQLLEVMPEASHQTLITSLGVLNQAIRVVADANQDGEGGE